MGSRNYRRRILNRISLYYRNYRQKKLEEGVPEDGIMKRMEYCRTFLQELLDQEQIPADFMTAALEEYEKGERDMCDDHIQNGNECGGEK